MAKLVKNIAQPGPDIPLCLNTSVSMMKKTEGRESTHVIPMDDEDAAQYETIPSASKPILVDELDRADTRRIIASESNQWNKHAIDIIDNDDGELLIDDNISVTSNQMDATSDCSEQDDASVDSRPGIIDNNLGKMGHQFAQGMDKDQKLWLRYHYNLKHLPNAHMCRLAEAGIIPRKLTKITPPICVACLKGKQHRRPWRGRGKRA